ncbi:MAG: hypothetical protein KAY24_19285, partial [Candidatus Eisenbacteria sp.]|nr:hypothetical protein [Candidatus Eisenbacteria bacterium]
MRHVINKTVGQQGFEEDVAEVLSSAAAGDVIAVPDAAAEKKVREAALKFGLGSDEEDVGIGIEVMAGTGGEVEFDESVLEHAVQAEDQSGFMAEVEEMVGRPDFDDQTIFVVADRKEIGWLFEAVAAHPEKVGKVRGTIFASNVIVTCLEDLPPAQVPQLAVRIDAGNLSAAMVQALGKAGFAVGFKAYTGVLRVDEDEIYLMVREGDSLVPTEALRVGVVGQEVRIALPVPEKDVPEVELTGAKP